MVRGDRPTMNDVAADAGVSLKTVSRVINQVASVDPLLAERVHASIARLGFRRNALAASLRAGSPDTIGLVVADLANAFYMTLASAVSAAAIPRGYQVIMASSEEDPAAERSIALDLCQRRVGGLLIVPTRADHAYLAAEVQLGTQVVFVDRPAAGLDADAVLIDNAGGAQAAVTRLVDAGHTRIALLLDSLEIFTMKERLTGARVALERAGAPVPDVVTDLHTPAHARDATAALLASDAPPTALFCGNNRITIGALEAMALTDVSVEVAGFDDFETSHLLPHEITIVDYDARLLGETAATRLLARIEGEDRPTEQLRVPTQLIRRGGAAH